MDVFFSLSRQESRSVSTLLDLFPRSTIVLSEPAPYLNVCGRQESSQEESFHVQWSRVRTCFGAIATYELNNDLRYDYFVRIRPDMYFFYPVSTWLQPGQDAIVVGETLWQQIGACTAVAPANDHFAVIPRLHAEMFAGAADILSRCEVSHEAIVGTSCHRCDVAYPECFLSTYLLLHNLSYVGCAPQYVPHEGMPISLWTIARDGGTSGLMDAHRHTPLEKLALLVPAVPPESVCKHPHVEYIFKGV